jgi:competence protein ComEA
VPDERRSHLFLWIAAGLLVLAVGYRILGNRSPEPPPVAVKRHAATEAPRSAARRVYVHIAGAVRRPGLYRVGENTRVGRALEVAGGPTAKADLAATNLAAQVEDGQQILVPVRGAVATATGPAATTATATSSGPISLASATQAQLEELDGIGPTLAARILEYRDDHGGFRSVEELGEVDGIGEVRLAALREAVQP